MSARERRPTATQSKKERSHIIKAKQMKAVNLICCFFCTSLPLLIHFEVVIMFAEDLRLQAAIYFDFARVYDLFLFGVFHKAFVLLSASHNNLFENDLLLLLKFLVCENFSS